MKSLLTTLSVLLILLSFSCTPQRPILWEVTPSGLPGQTTTIMGAPTKTWGREGATAVGFDGVDDGMLIDHNPIANAEEFTVEVIFKPSAAQSSNKEQSLLHLQDPANPNRSLLMELKLTENNQWFANYFLKSDNGELTLMDASKTHPVDQWATMTLVYKDKKVTGYVNGQPEVRGELEVLPLPASSKTSIGTRMDQRSWFNGEIETIRYFKTALLPKKYSEGIPTTTR